MNGAGNDPTLALADHFDGPPWIITVGGAQATSGGETILAARGLDVAANFSETIATHRSLDGTATGIGTSLGTPLVAATLAEALRIATSLPEDKVERRDALRAALNATAVPFTPAGWKQSPPGATYQEVLSLTNPVLVPGPQMGWGYVDASMAPRLADIASGTDAPVDASTPRALWQERWQAARVAYWGDGTGRG